MTKDREYYESRLKAKADRMYAEETEGMTIRQVLDEKMDVYENMNVIGFLSRISLHFNEAKVIIRKLVDNFDDEDPDKIYDLLWVDRVTELFGKGELMTANSTKAEMIERIQWISNEDFGEDIFEWSDWLEAFEADIPSWGDR